MLPSWCQHYSKRFRAACRSKYFSKINTLSWHKFFCYKFGLVLFCNNMFISCCFDYPFSRYNFSSCGSLTQDHVSFSIWFRTSSWMASKYLSVLLDFKACLHERSSFSSFMTEVCVKFCPDWVGTFTCFSVLSGSIVFAVGNKHSSGALFISQAAIPGTILTGSKWVSELKEGFEFWVISLCGTLPSASESLSHESSLCFSSCETLSRLPGFSAGTFWLSVICSRTSVPIGFYRRLTSSISWKS